MKIRCLAFVAVVMAGVPQISSAYAGQNADGNAFGKLATVTDDTLSSMHGRGGNITYAVAGTNNLSASINGSTITAGGNITNGSVTFSGNSMQNFSGLSNFVANTGSNNNLQAAMVLNVTLN